MRPADAQDRRGQIVASLTLTVAAIVVHVVAIGLVRVMTQQSVLSLTLEILPFLFGVSVGTFTVAMMVIESAVARGRSWAAGTFVLAVTLAIPVWILMAGVFWDAGYDLDIKLRAWLGLQPPPDTDKDSNVIGGIILSFAPLILCPFAAWIAHGAFKRCCR